MFPSPPSNLPPDPVTPVPLPPVRRMAMPGTVLLASLLAGLSMLGPFSIDAYLPAFPAIQADLKATPIEVQQTLTAFMLAFAAMVLWHGALADAFGRRNVILVALVIFAIGTFGCAASHSVHYLWIFRIMQGVSAGAGVVVGRAIIRDWRTIFLSLLGYTVLLFIYCYKRLPETLPPEKRQPFNPKFLWQSYSTIFSSPLFHMKAGVVALNFAGLFLYIAAAPVMLPVHLHLGPDQFGWLFIPSVAGIFLGALAANRIAGKISYSRQIGIGFGFLLTAGAVNVLYHSLFPPALPWSVAPMFVYTFGMSFIAPGATLLTLDLFPHIRGTVASCQSFALTLLGALVAGVIAPILSHSVLWLAIGQAGFALLALALWVASRIYRRRLARNPVL
jgi:DHA1 family bicyclomycin/chloramphenicol resistance-like MFS transporter